MPGLFGICCIMSLLVGCGWQATRPLANVAPPPGSVYLVHLPGIAGDTPFDRWWMNALKEGGAADRVELYDWTCHDPWIHALQAYEGNHQQAQRVAELIVAKYRADPRAKVILTAESGGTGIAVWALERLPKNVQVQSLLLIAPAISPGYDLTAALCHVRGKAYAFTSGGDWFMLGAGTRLYGTIDGKRTEAAGLVGFHRPARADAAQYHKLVEMKYDPNWIIWGNFGSHSGGMSSAFARHVLAPLLIRSEAGEKPEGLQTERAAARLPGDSH